MLPLDIYSNPRLTKATAYLMARVPDGVPNVFDTLDMSIHSRKRRAIGEILSERSMRTFEPTMNDQIDVFLRELLHSSQKGQVINMTPRCERLAIDNICHLAFGYPVDSQTSAKNRLVVEAMTLIMARVSLCMNWPAVAAIVNFIVFTLGKKQVDAFGANMHNMISSRTAMEKKAKHDLFSTTFSIPRGATTGSLEGLDEKEVWSEAGFFIIAGMAEPLIEHSCVYNRDLTTSIGGVTSSATLAGLFFYLSHYPEVYSKLAAEIRSTFTSGREIRGGAKLKNCAYLRAVIDETLRISPSSLGTFWRELDPAQDPTPGKPFIVDGHVIPPGTAVGVSPYSILHNPEYFPDPFTFMPERWLGDCPESGGAEDTENRPSEATLMRRAFLPFGAGDRGCAGKAVAYLETSLMLARTIWYFDFAKASGQDGEVGQGGEGQGLGRERKNEFQLYDCITAETKGPNIVFTPRAQHWEDLLQAK